MRWLVMVLLLGLVACGVETQKPDAQPVAQTPVTTGPTTGNPPPATGDKITYAQMQTFMVNYCQSCHSNDPFIKSESALRASEAKTRLGNKSMPPSFAPKALPDNVRTQMLSFF